jgi:hypothetical protein
MKMTVKPLTATLALLTIALVPACGGLKAQPTAANGNSTGTATGSAGNATNTTGNGTSTAGNGTSTAGNGTSTAGNGTSTAGSGTNTTGNSPEKTSTTPGTSPPPNSGAEPATNNVVVLGVQFFGAPAVSFGNVLPGQSATLRIELRNGAVQSVTIVSITTGDTAFSPSTECNGRTMNPGDSCAFSVTFSPTDARNYSSYLKVTANPADPGVSEIPAAETSLEGNAGPPTAGSPSAPSQTFSPPASQLAPADSSSPPASQPAPAGSSSP